MIVVFQSLTGITYPDDRALGVGWGCQAARGNGRDVIGGEHNDRIRGGVDDQAEGGERDFETGIDRWSAWSAMWIGPNRARSWRCQRKSAAEVAKKTDQRARGSSRDRAASTTRSAGCSWARWICRRRTATSCRSTSSSMSLAPSSRASWVNICRICRSSWSTSEALMTLDRHREFATAGGQRRTSTHPNRVSEPHRLEPIGINGSHRHRASLTQERPARPRALGITRNQVSRTDRSNLECCYPTTGATQEPGRGPTRPPRVMRWQVVGGRVRGAYIRRV